MVFFLRLAHHGALAVSLIEKGATMSTYSMNALAKALAVT